MKKDGPGFSGEILPARDSSTRLPATAIRITRQVSSLRGKWYFIYHNGALVPDAGSFHRSVCIDYLQYNNDGTMKRVAMTSEGVPAAK